MYREMVHPHVLQCYGFSRDENYFYIVTEKMEGNLSELLYGSKKRKLSSDEKFRIAIQIAEGLLHAKHRNIVHRDIKSANILYDKSLNIKIADFGISKVKSGNFTNTVTLQGAGTLQWMAPETLTSRQFGFASDVYSFGILLYEIVEESPPYPDLESLSSFEFTMKLLNGVRPFIRDISSPHTKKLCDLQARCLLGQPNTRITIEGIQDILMSFYDMSEKIRDELSLKQYLEGPKFNKAAPLLPLLMKRCCVPSIFRTILQFFILVVIGVSCSLSPIGYYYWSTGIEKNGLYLPETRMFAASLTASAVSLLLFIFLGISLIFNLRFRQEEDMSVLELAIKGCCACASKKSTDK